MTSDFVPGKVYPVNHRITQLPNGKWIAEVEIESHGLANTLIGLPAKVSRWDAVYTDGGCQGATRRGADYFACAQYATQAEARSALATYLSDFYGEVMTEGGPGVAP